MTISVFYYEQEPQGGYVSPFRVAYYPDFPHAVTILPDTEQRVLDFVAGGGTIEPYVTPEAPPTNDELDATSLNAALTQPGTVTRAIGEILFGVIKGTIPVTPSMTKPQFVALVKSKMRNGG